MLKLLTVVLCLNFLPQATGTLSLRGSVDSPTPQEPNDAGRRLGSILRGFTLINAKTDAALFEVSNGDTINLANLPTKELNLRANVANPSVVDRVVFKYGGQTQTEGKSPYALGGDRNGDYHAEGWLATTGTKRITVKAYRKNSNESEEETISLNVVNQGANDPKPTLTTLLKGFTLINADTSSDLFEVSNGATINLGELPTRNLNLRADTAIDSSLIDRVTFRYDGKRQTEGVAPFALGGDKRGSYYAVSWLSSPGTKTVEVEASINGAGSETVVISFNIADAGNDDEPSPSDDPETPIDPNPGSPGRLLEGFTLINADTDKELFEVLSGDVIRLSDLPSTHLNLRANVVDESLVKRVVFHFGNNESHGEGKAPFCLGGDKAGNYGTMSWLSSSGTKTVSAKVFNVNGNEVEEHTISFEIVGDGAQAPEDPAPAPVIPPAPTPVIPPATVGDSPFLEEDGLVVMEVESVPVASPWMKEKKVKGYTGSHYYRFNGNTVKTGPPLGTLSYFIKIANPGKYRMSIRSYKDNADPTWSNDCYTKLVGHPGYQGKAVKTYMGGSANTWRYSTNHEVDGKKPIPYYTFSSPGVYELQVMGRSKNFYIDRIVLFDEKKVSSSKAENDSVHESRRLSTKSAPEPEPSEPEPSEPEPREPEPSQPEPSNPGDGKVTVTGELRTWHKITFAFNGPTTSETAKPNPFTDYRLDVTFTKGSEKYVVPGYFAADGNAADTSADSGSVWHCHFVPPSTGTWTWKASFLTGSNVAQQWPGSVSGKSLSPIDGLQGTFDVEKTNKSGRDLRSKGMLRYVGKHHLQFAETGEYFMKAGADSPENLLAYSDFDNTPNNKNLRKSWSPHQKDAKASDPTWKNGKGSELLGAINYLSSKGMNAFSFLTFNIKGDDQNVFMYRSPSNYLQIDVSKTAQWERVFEHADTKGMYLHFKTQEQENDSLLDGGDLGNERKLYYRELVARFGHHLALNWNLGEENENTSRQQKLFSDYFKAVDPYGHIVVVHTHIEEQAKVYGPLYGYRNFDGASIQARPDEIFQLSLEVVEKSDREGRPWIVANDEQGNAKTGVMPDKNDKSHNAIRTKVLYANLMAGGAGVEYYFGYGFDHSDLTCQDWRSRDVMWDQSRYALEFFSNVPFQNMSNDNGRVSNGNWLLKDSSGENIVVYLRNGGTAKVDLREFGTSGQEAVVKWYNPRTGGSFQNGSIQSVKYGSPEQALGTAPSSGNDDWLVLLQAK